MFKKLALLFLFLFSTTSIFGQSLHSLNSQMESLNSLGQATCNEGETNSCVCLFDPVIDNVGGATSDKRLIYKITDPEQIPELVRDELPIPTSEISKGAPFYISLWQDNDNLAFDAIKGGNDLGYTTGMQLEVGGVNKKGITYGGHIYTGLYTRRVLAVQVDKSTVDFRDFSGDWTNYKKEIDLKKDEKIISTKGEQTVRFNETTVLSAFVNNKQQGQWLLWDMKFGLAIDESQKTNKYRATGIQNSWHKLMNMVDYKYIPDKNDTRYALYLKAVVGAQNRLFENQNCSLDIDGSLGANLGTSGMRNFVIAEIQANLGLLNNKKTNEKKINFNIGTKSSTGQLKQINASAGININFHKIIITNQLMIPLTNGYSDGVGIPFVDKDPIHRIGIIVPIRR